jgi:hypothetical protein
MNIDTYSKTEQRKFGVVMAVAIAVLGLIRYALHGFEHLPVWFFVTAIIFLVLGLSVPQALRPVLVVWIKFSLVLNWFMTRLLLSVAFLAMIVPARFILFLRRKDPLKRAWEPERESYWEEPEEQPTETDRYFNQF